MRLLVPWGVNSPRLQALLEQRDACPHCGCQTVRLVRHIIGPSHSQVWVACVRCSAKGCGDGPQPHIPGHPRLHAYPIWRADMTAALEPEEFDEIENARPRPLAWGELTRELFNPGHRALDRFRERTREKGFINIAWNFALPDELACLASLFAHGEYIAARLPDESARLLRLEARHAAMLSPFVVDGRIDWGRPVLTLYTPQSL
jgi:hypothetical protein